MLARVCSDAPMPGLPVRVMRSQPSKRLAEPRTDQERAGSPRSCEGRTPMRGRASRSPSRAGRAASGPPLPRLWDATQSRHACRHHAPGAAAYDAQYRARIIRRVRQRAWYVTASGCRPMAAAIARSGKRRSAMLRCDGQVTRSTGLMVSQAGSTVNGERATCRTRSITVRAYAPPLATRERASRAHASCSAVNGGSGGAP